MKGLQKSFTMMQVPSKMDANLASNDKSPEELFSVEQKIIKKNYVIKIPFLFLRRRVTEPRYVKKKYMNLKGLS